MSGPKRRVWTGSTWHGKGIPDQTPVVAGSRDAMVYGVTKPNTTTWAGVIGGDTLAAGYTNVSPASGNVITLPAGTYTKQRFWGQVKASGNVVLRDCPIAGPAPDSLSFGGLTKGSNPEGNNLGVVQNYGSNPPMIEMWDCTMDPGMWLQSGAPGGARSKLNLFVTGWHGGNGRLYRCEIKNIQDGVNYLGPSTLAAALQSEFTMKGSWVHKGSYGNNVYNNRVNDGQPHADAFQTNYGRNITLEGNYFGGTRNPVGYMDWATGPTWEWAHSSNTGDDFWNAGLMLQQEVGYTPGGDDTDYRNICNVKIINNWWDGGNCTINIASVQARPNTFASVEFSGNRIVRRTSGYGDRMRGDAQDTPGYVVAQPASAPNGYHVLRGSLWAGIWANNVFDDNGDPVTVTNGGIS